MRSDKFSQASRLRMIRLYIYLKNLDYQWLETKQTSRDLAASIGTTGTSLRKDLSILGCQAEGWGYRGAELIPQLEKHLLLDLRVVAGIAGLEPWGSVLLSNPELLPGLHITAGFDSNMNRLERMSTNIPLYPSHEIPEVFREKEIKLGVISSGGGMIQKTAERMVKGGALAILNLTPRILDLPEGVFTYQADIQSGILMLLSQINGSSNQKE